MAAHGRVELVFARDGARTALRHQYSRAPLHVQGLLHGSGATAEVALLNVAGGVLGGDRLELDATAEAGAHARLSTVGATRLYCCRDEVPARSRVVLRIAAGALLEYLPDETIPYAGALYEQLLEVHLAAGGRAIIGEVVGPGRLHRGEVFAYRRLSLRVRADVDGTPLLGENLTLEPHRLPPTCAAILGPYTHLASLYACGPGADAALAAGLHDLFASGRVHGSATVGAGEVVVWRAAGHGAYPLLRMMRAVADHCRRHMHVCRPPL